ncbi:flavodoxin family protein [Pseudomonadota bacterium]
MPELLVVSHTPSDNTRSLTDWVLSGASSALLTVTCSRPLETGPEQVLAADGLILGTTENFGYMSGAMKDFFDRIYYPCLEKTRGMPYALFIRAGQDGTGARTSIERIVTGLGWRAVQEPLICRGEVSEFQEPCRQLGELMAIGLQDGIF